MCKDAHFSIPSEIECYQLTDVCQSGRLFVCLFVYLFIYGCVGSPLLRAGFLSCGERGLLFVVVRGLLIAVASLVADHGL